MEKKIADFLHLYLGCECELNKDGYFFPHTVLLDAGLLGNAIGLPEVYKVKPILRPLSDMTDAESKEVAKLLDMGHTITTPIVVKYNFTQWAMLWYLSKQFDLFNLIKSGLAIDKTKIKKLV